MHPKGQSRVNFCFIIYINDLPGVVSEGNKIVVYADESKLYKVIHSLHLGMMIGVMNCEVWILLTS